MVPIRVQFSLSSWLILCAMTGCAKVADDTAIGHVEGIGTLRLVDGHFEVIDRDGPAQERDFPTGVAVSLDNTNSSDADLKELASRKDIIALAERPSGLFRLRDGSFSSTTAPWQMRRQPLHHTRFLQIQNCLCLNHRDPSAAKLSARTDLCIGLPTERHCVGLPVVISVARPLTLETGLPLFQNWVVKR
jgi:hypothetical protein